MRIAVDLTPIRSDGSAGGVTGLSIELLKELNKHSDVKLILLCADWNKEFLTHIFGSKAEYQLVITAQNNEHESFLQKVCRKLDVKYPWNRRGMEYEADILFCPFSAVNYKKIGIPVVSTINDIQHEFYPQFFTPNELQHRRNFYNNIVDNADRIICISNYTKTTFCDFYNYSNELATTIYVGIQERFREEDRSILEKLKIESGKYIVFPANFWEHKNHKLLLNAFGMFAVKHPEGKLVLTGNALGQEEYYNKMIDAMGLHGRVIITGYLNEQELYAILNNAKGLIYPSLFEGFGIPLVEAMQMNKLIASSNQTSLPEVGGDSVFYFNPKKPDEILNGIRFLFQSEMDIEREKKYRCMLQKYTMDTMAKEYLEVFRRAISDGPKLKKGAKVRGIYGDGWSSDTVSFHVTKHKGDILCLKFRVPQHIKGKMKIVAGGVAQKYEYSYEQLNELSEIIKSDNECIEIKLPSTWNPDTIMHSGDNRELGIMIECMELLTRDGAEKIDIL